MIRRAHLLLFVCILSVSTAHAKDLGTFGQTFAIAEIDMLKWIAARLDNMQKTGEMDAIQHAFVKDVKKGAARPKPVEGLFTTTSPTTFTIDPSIVVKRDIMDTTGRVLVKSGTHVNPFKKLGHAYRWHLAFFDADDVRQVHWAQQIIAQYPHTTKLILTNGDVNRATKQLKQKIFFDQGGFITQKLRIAHLPSLAFEHNFLWQITEFDASRYPANPVSDKEKTQ